MIAPLAIDLRALRTLVGPDINIVPGRAMMARVVGAPQGGRGSLSIAGFLVEAELPANVQAGQDLRLVVQDVNQQRVLLAISPHDKGAEAAQAQAQTQGPAQAQTQHAAQTPLATPPPLAVPLPGGGMLHVTERDASGGGGRPGGGSAGLSLRYEAPALGAVDLRLALDPGTVHVGVTLPAAAAALAQSDAASLHSALAAAVPDRSVNLTIAPRREPLDLYA